MWRLDRRRGLKWHEADDGELHRASTQSLSKSPADLLFVCLDWVFVAVYNYVRAGVWACVSILL